MEIGDLFVGSKPVSLDFIYFREKESFFGGLLGNLSVGLGDVYARIGENFLNYSIF